MKKHLLFSLTAIFLAGAAFAQNDDIPLIAKKIEMKATQELIYNK